MYKLKPKRDGLQRNSTKLVWKQEGTQRGWFGAFISLWTNPGPCACFISELSCPPPPHHFALLPPSFRHHHRSLPLGSYLAPPSLPSCLYLSWLLSFLSVHACKLKAKENTKKLQGSVSRTWTAPWPESSIHVLSRGAANSQQQLTTVSELCWPAP